MRLFSSIHARLVSALIPFPASITAGGKTIRKEGKTAFQTDLCKCLNICTTEHLLDESSAALQRPGDMQDLPQRRDLCTEALKCFS